jgi:hypothetical protein
MGAMELGWLVFVGLLYVFILGFLHALESISSLYGFPL